MNCIVLEYPKPDGSYGAARISKNWIQHRRAVDAGTTHTVEIGAAALSELMKDPACFPRTYDELRMPRTITAEAVPVVRAALVLLLLVFRSCCLREYQSALAAPRLENRRLQARGNSAWMRKRVKIRKVVDGRRRIGRLGCSSRKFQWSRNCG